MSWDEHLRKQGVVCVAGAAITVGVYWDMGGAAVAGAGFDGLSDAGATRGTIFAQEGRGGYLVLGSGARVEVVAPRQLRV
jgi:hypothetical protein